MAYFKSHPYKRTIHITGPDRENNPLDNHPRKIIPRKLPPRTTIPRKIYLQGLLPLEDNYTPENIPKGQLPHEVNCPPRTIMPPLLGSLKGKSTLILSFNKRIFFWQRWYAPRGNLPGGGGE